MPASPNSSNPVSEALRFDPDLVLLEVFLLVDLLVDLPGWALLSSVVFFAGNMRVGTSGWSMALLVVPATSVSDNRKKGDHVNIPTASHITYVLTIWLAFVNFASNMTSCPLLSFFALQAVSHMRQVLIIVRT
jgi:hypothetical protein